MNNVLSTGQNPQSPQSIAERKEELLNQFKLEFQERIDSLRTESRTMTEMLVKKLKVRKHRLPKDLLNVKLKDLDKVVINEDDRLLTLRTIRYVTRMATSRGPAASSSRPNSRSASPLKTSTAKRAVTSSSAKKRIVLADNSTAARSPLKDSMSTRTRTRT